MQDNNAFTIAICSYNRAHLLMEALTAVAELAPIDLPWELVVIDNNSSDGTQDVVREFFVSNPDITGKCIIETNQGLSHARNRAYKEAKSDWIFYLDDDAKAKENTLSQLLWLISNTEFQIVGGVYYPWYYYGRPKWFKDSYGSNSLGYTKLTKISPPHAACGGVMLWKKSLLEELDGFNTEIGMIGDKIAYGEETYLQEAARAQGVEIAYDPDLVIYHVVMETKLNVDWFFKSYFARGRDAVLSGSVGTSFISIAKQLCIGVVVMSKDLLVCTPRLLSKNYYLENWIIDVFRKFAKRLGSIYTAILMNR